MWNMQSGIKRKSFDVGPCPLEVVNRFTSAGKRMGGGRCITGLASDALNRAVIASTLDGTIAVRLIVGHPISSCFTAYSYLNHVSVLRLPHNKTRNHVDPTVDSCVNITASQ